MVYDLVHLKHNGAGWVMRSHILKARTQKSALSEVEKFLAETDETEPQPRQPVRLIKTTVVKRWTKWKKSR